MVSGITAADDLLVVSWCNLNGSAYNHCNQDPNQHVKGLSYSREKYTRHRHTGDHHFNKKVISVMTNELLKLKYY